MRRMGSKTVDAEADDELLSTLLGRGATEIAGRVIRESGGLALAARATPAELAAMCRLGPRQAERVAAAFELGRRALRAVDERVSVGGPADVHALLAPRLVGVVQEMFFVLGLDIRNGLVGVVEVARGSVASVEVHPREVFRPLIRMAAACGVLAHNHPSGDPTPSDEDVNLTQRMKDIGNLVGIPIIDHVVIAGGRYQSLGEVTT